MPIMPFETVRSGRSRIYCWPDKQVSRWDLAIRDLTLDVVLDVEADDFEDGVLIIF